MLVRRHPGKGLQARGEPVECLGLAGLDLDAIHREREPVEELIERTLDDEPAAVEDADAVADPLDVGEDMAREQHRRLAAERGDELEHVAPALGVERAHGLIEDQDGGRWTRVPAIPSRWRMPPE